MESDYDMSMTERYDTALIGILQHEGEISKFLNVIMGFLLRRTDYFLLMKDKDAKMGFPPGAAAKVLYDTFKKYDKIARAKEAKAAARQMEIVDGPSHPTDTIPPAAISIVEIESENVATNGPSLPSQPNDTKVDNITTNVEMSSISNVDKSDGSSNKSDVKSDGKSDTKCDSQASNIDSSDAISMSKSTSVSKQDTDVAKSKESALSNGNVTDDDKSKSADSTTSGSSKKSGDETEDVLRSLDLHRVPDRVGSESSTSVARTRVVGDTGKLRALAAMAILQPGSNGKARTLHTSTKLLKIFYKYKLPIGTNNHAQGQRRPVYSADAEWYNGAVRDNYSWSQSINDLDIYVTVPPHIQKGRQVKVKIEKNRLHISHIDTDNISWSDVMGGDMTWDIKVDEVVWTLVPGKHIHVNNFLLNITSMICGYIDDNISWSDVMGGDMTWDIKVDEVVWMLVPGKHIHLNLEKTMERWWDAILTDEPKINVREIDASRPMSDLGDEEQAKLGEMMFNQRQKQMGLPQSHEMQTQEMLKKAWNAEGSPFAGTPYDPSSVNISGDQGSPFAGTPQ